MNPNAEMRDGVPIVRLESEHLEIEIAPAVGGRVLRLREKAAGHEFLWRNRSLRLERLPAGSEYDPNFYGGIDELLPNDIPEPIDGLECPDHGELWTTELEVSPAEPKETGNRTEVTLRGKLPRFGLGYDRTMRLRPKSPHLDFQYRLTNLTNQPRRFLWKLHAALAVAAGDVIDCPARYGQVVDRAWSTHRTLAPFEWPRIEGQAANVVPAANGTVEFFYLFGLQAGRMGWRRPGTGLAFEYQFDPKVFPYAWLFASYGGFNGHYVVVLEPCSAMPISVAAAAALGQCSVLEPGASLETQVSIRVEGGHSETEAMQ